MKRPEQFVRVNRKPLVCQSDLEVSLVVVVFLIRILEFPVEMIEIERVCRVCLVVGTETDEMNSLFGKSSHCRFKGYDLVSLAEALLMTTRVSVSVRYNKSMYFCDTKVR